MTLRFSKSFKITISFILSIVGVILFLLIIGFTVDCFTYPSLKRTGNEALEDLKSLRIDKPGNAWDYYSIAIEKSRNIKPDKMRIGYIRGKIEITPEIIKAIEVNTDAIREIKEGARQDFCSVSFNYKKGLSVDIPDFTTLKRITEILCVNSLRELEEGNAEEALNDIFTVATVGKHLASVAPTVLDQMVGGVLISQALSVLRIGVSSSVFNKNELKKVAQFLDEMEKDWPPLYQALDTQTKLLKITIANITLSRTLEIVLLPHHQKKPSIFLKSLVRLVYWRYLFSPRLAFLKNFEFFDTIISEMQEIESTSSKVIKRGEIHKIFPDIFQKRINENVRKNPIPLIFIPKFSNKGRLVNITKMRMLRLSSVISSYRLENGFFPPTLEEFEYDIVIDPNTGEMFVYTNYEDSVRIFSPGLNISNPGDDITILLTKMGIKKYLEKRRKIK